MRLDRFLIVFLAVLLMGCSSKPRLNIQPIKPLPQWYLNPSYHDVDVLRGVGAGINLEAATQAALNNLLSQLGISIQSNFTSHTYVNDHRYSKESSQSIATEVSKVRISNYRVVNSEQIKFNEFVVLVESNKPQLIRDLTAEVDQRFASIDQRMLMAQQDHALKRYDVAHTASLDAEALNPTLLILQGIDQKFPLNHYQNKTQQIHQEKERARKALSFTVTGNTLSPKIGISIGNALAQSGFVVLPKTANKQGVLQIEVMVTMDQSTSAGFQIVNMTINTQVRDEQSNVIGSNRVLITGHATRGWALAEEDAIRKANILLAEEGVAAFVGIAL